MKRGNVTLWMQDVFGGARVQVQVEGDSPRLSLPRSCSSGPLTAREAGCRRVSVLRAATGARMRRTMPGCMATTDLRSARSSRKCITSTVRRVRGCHVNVPLGQDDHHRVARPALLGGEHRAQSSRPVTRRNLEIQVTRGHRPAGGRRVPVGRPARAHELRRPLPQHVADLAAQAARRGSRRHLQPLVNKEQRIPDIALLRRRRRDARRRRDDLPGAGVSHQLLGTPRPAGSRGPLPDAGFQRAISRARSHRRIRTTARWLTLRTRRARSSAMCIRSTGRSCRKRRSRSTNALPVDVALGKVDYIEVVGLLGSQGDRCRSGIGC